MRRSLILLSRVSIFSLMMGVSSTAIAEDAADQQEDSTSPIIVTGTLENPLVTTSPTASRLGLTPLETPASVYTVDRDSIRALGDVDFNEAVSRAPGLAQSQSPGNGTLSITSRGFGGDSVMQLFNGVRLFPNNGSLSFPFDTWNIDRIEVLTGPASVLYGQGAMGGVINVIPKAANFERLEVDAEARYGSFQTYQAGVGVGAPIAEGLAVRADASVRASDGYVDRGNSSSVALSGAVEFRPSDAFSLVLRHDFGDQSPMNYWGTPLANGTRLDTSIRERNYNVSNGVLEFEDNRTQVDLNWKPSQSVAITAAAYRLKSWRMWENLESYFYDFDAGVVERADNYGITHDVTQKGGQANIRLDSNLGGGLLNQLVLGVDANVIDMTYGHSFDTDPQADAVDPNNFNPGTFLDTVGLAPRYRTRTETWAIYGENRLEIAEQLSIIGGARYEWDKVERYNFVYDASGQRIISETPAFAAGTQAARKFRDFTWRVGAVYQPAPNLSLFAQYVTGVDALGMLTTPSTAAAQIAFTNARGNQIEAGIKSTFLNGNGWASVSVFRIVKNDLAVQRTIGAPIEQIGQQSSKGIEAAFAVKLPAGFSINANGTILDANYDDYPSGAVSYTGKTPPGVPESTANVTLQYTLGAFQARGSLRYVGKRYSNIANTIEIPDYTIFDAGISYAMTKNVAVDFRVFNLTDEDYAIDNYGSQQWILGRPRAFEIGVRTSF